MATLQGPHFVHPGETVRADQPLEALFERVARSPQERVAVLERLLGESACRAIGVYPFPADCTLSVVIPVYDEKRWIREIVHRVEEVPIPKEIVLVDDCSTDGTRDILKEIAERQGHRVVFQPRNQGKGAAL